MHGVCVVDTLRDLHGNLSPIASNCTGNFTIMSIIFFEDSRFALSLSLTPSFSAIALLKSDNCSSSDEVKLSSLILD